VRIAWASDIHLNFVPESRFQVFCKSVVDSGAETLLLGGDISEASDLPKDLINLKDCTRIPTYYVLGNHDYYGSDISYVRRRVLALEQSGLSWLPGAGVIELEQHTGLVGNGGWGDGLHGDLVGSNVLLNDFILIEDLRQVVGSADIDDFHGRKADLGVALRDLGNAAAETLAPQLRSAAERFEQVLILTHVPPYPESCWYQGRMADNDWLPHFTCKAIGDLLSDVANDHPGTRFLVLCGHTHSSGAALILPNLEVRTQGADYGNPQFEILDTDESFAHRRM